MLTVKMLILIFHTEGFWLHYSVISIWRIHRKCRCLIFCFFERIQLLTHWGRVTHICISKLIMIGSDNGLSLGRRQAIIWTNDGILLIRTFRTHFSELVSEIHTFPFKKMHFKMSGKWRPSCRGLNVLKGQYNIKVIILEDHSSAVNKYSPVYITHWEE